MSNHPILQVDAFTDSPLGGNPCAVVFDAGDMPAELMQAVAREMNLSETAFVMHSDVADYRVRYFTPAEEIPLAGHPTIATTYALVQSGRLKIEAEHTVLTLELQVGPIRVDIFAERGAVQRIIMTQKKPAFMQQYSAEDVAPVFNLTADDLLPGSVVQTVSTGTPQLMMVLRNLEALKKARVDIPSYVALREKGDFFSPHLFCLTGVTNEGHTFARHFGTPPDIFEDPFTGSATGGMAAYLWRYGLIDRPQFTAEQGHWMDRPGQAFVEIIGPPENIETVRVGGNAALVMRGELVI